MPVSFLSQRVKSLAPSATLAANDKAKQLAASGVDVINLTAGEPDFNTPDFIKKAAYQAITDNKTTYTAVDGIPELKQAIIHKLERDNALSYESNQIIASCGVKQALFNITQAEHGFTLLENALNQTDSGECNEGLIRPEAQLILIGVSDEPEQSVQSYSDFLTTFRTLK